MSESYPCLSPGDIQVSLQRMSAGGGGLAGTRDLVPFSAGKRDFKANLGGKRDDF